MKKWLLLLKAAFVVHVSHKDHLKFDNNFWQ